MSDEIPHDIVALYRAGATGEPGATLDEAVLAAAHRRHAPNLAAMATLAFAAAVVAVVIIQHPVVNAPVAANSAGQARDAVTDPYVALDAGTNHYLAIDAGAIHDRSIGSEPQPIVRNAHVVPLPGDSQ